MTLPIRTRKKLIEVALPLDAINRAAAREKSIRKGHPSTLHLWWARRPLAAARAVIFAQLVDDPSAWPELFPTDEAQDRERDRLFRLMERLVTWEGTHDETALRAANEEIVRSWARARQDNEDHPSAAQLFPEGLPAFHDPFAGGGALPLEAQRLGLAPWASDLNPVAVSINKAMVEVPALLVGQPPVGPVAEGGSPALADWGGSSGLAEDLRRYGSVLRAEAEKRIGRFYPTVGVTEELAADRPDLAPYRGKDLPVITWLWCRTVKSPNPAFAHVDVPLVSSFILSSRKGREAFVEPIVDADGFRFKVRLGVPEDLEAAQTGTRFGRAQDFYCLMSNAPIERSYIQAEGKAGRLGCRLMAIVAGVDRGRTYVSPVADHETLALECDAMPAVIEARETFLSGATPSRAMITGGVCSAYGLSTWGSLFTSRQLLALLTASDLVREIRDRVVTDATAAGLPLGRGLSDPAPEGALARADAIALYLAFAVDRSANTLCTLARWTPAREQTVTAFSRQALPMTWDFPDVNPFAGAAGDLGVSLGGVIDALASLPCEPAGHVEQLDAAVQALSANKVVSTDPPYYDNIGYAELADFFYAWLRRSARDVLPGVFSTVTSPKTQELVATRHRHGGQQEAEAFFMAGMKEAIGRLASDSHPAFPTTIYYAFKQSETSDAGGTSSTGWETFLEAVIQAGFSIVGTWPMRTELGNRMIGRGVNALASSVVLVCRRTPADAPIATRRELLAALKAELPTALRHLQHGNIAPVDLAQSAIGPGMAVFTRFARVLDADGSAVSVREALALINQTLDEVLAEQEGEFDADTRWAVSWFDQVGFDDGEFGQADVLARAKNTSVTGLEAAGIVASGRGKVRLLRAGELQEDWDPRGDDRLTIWEATHHLVRRLSDGEAAAASLVQQLGGVADAARDLAYRLYVMCERRKRSTDAVAYNALVESWGAIQQLAREASTASAGDAVQGTLEV